MTKEGMIIILNRSKEYLKEKQVPLIKMNFYRDGTYFYILKYTDEENKKHDRSGYLYLKPLINKAT